MQHATSKTEQHIIINELNSQDNTSGDDEIGYLDLLLQYEEYTKNSTQSLKNITEGTYIIGEEFNKRTAELNKARTNPYFSNQVFTTHLTRTAKSMDDYTNRLKLEIPIYYENFESSIKAGSQYINTVNQYNTSDYLGGLNSYFDANKELKLGISTTIISIQGLYEQTKTLPNVYSVFNKSKNTLLKQIEKWLATLKNSYNLVNEFQGLIEYKISLANN